MSHHISLLVNVLANMWHITHFHVSTSKLPKLRATLSNALLEPIGVHLVASRDFLSEDQKRKIRIDLKRIPEWEKTRSVLLADLNKFEKRRLLAALDEVEDCKLGPWLPHLRKVVLSEAYLWDFYSSACGDLTPYSDYLEAAEKSLASASKSLEEVARSATKSVFLAIVLCRTHSSYVDRVTSANNAEHLRVVKIRSVREHYEYLRLFFVTWRAAHKGEALAEVNALLRKAYTKRDAIKRFERKHGNAHAKAATLDKKARTHARKLRTVVAVSTECPYCGQPLDENRHLDHIYPVKHGGLSTADNLVWACARCNSRKSDMGLIEFVRSQGFSLDTVTTRLNLLGKKI